MFCARLRVIVLVFFYVYVFTLVHRCKTDFDGVRENCKTVYFSHLQLTKYHLEKTTKEQVCLVVSNCEMCAKQADPTRPNPTTPDPTRP